jgi:hypothetical protein
MIQYFKAYKYDLKTLRKIWDKISIYELDHFHAFTTICSDFCWTIDHGKITGYCNENWYKNADIKEVGEDFVTKILKEDKMPTIISANEARKILNENIDGQIEIILKDIDLSIKEAIKRLENSIKVEFNAKFSNIVDILEDSGYILTTKNSEPGNKTIIVEISW